MAGLLDWPARVPVLLDLMYVAIALASFGLCWRFVKVCDRL
jgi:hypothetical protein